MREGGHHPTPNWLSPVLRIRWRWASHVNGRGSLAGGRRGLVGDCTAVGVMASLLGITSAASEARANGVPTRDGSFTQHSIAAVRASHRTAVRQH